VPRARTDLEQLEERFAESRRRAAERREGRRPRGSGRIGALGRVAALGVVALALVGGVAAKSEAPAAAPKARAATEVDRLRCPIPRELRQPFRAAARESGVALGLLVAVAYEESQMKQWARSPKGALGLMQVLPSTARELGIDVTNARGNVRAGALYLAEMLRRFGDDLDLALAAYNAGPAAVARAGAIPSQETLGYVLGVKARTALLRGCR
jgi:soluble lytic murein transglycosylase-like protein